MLAGLTAREAKVLRMRFGIDMNTDHTLEEVGKTVRRYPRERIRQIEAKALRKLRHPSRSEVLRSFLGRLIGRPDQGVTPHPALGPSAQTPPFRWRFYRPRTTSAWSSSRYASTSFSSETRLKPLGFGSTQICVEPMVRVCFPHCAPRWLNPCSYACLPRIANACG